MTYQFEYEQRVASAFVGAGGHSYRNVYPTFQYAPVDLRAVCDLDADRAATYARAFGAAASYQDHREMLEAEEPEAVFVVTNFDPNGRLQSTDIAIDCLRAGAHVWLEKPTATSAADVKKLMRVADETGRFVMTGMKKAFTPAMEKVKEIISSQGFGPVSSITVRYPQSIPPFEDRTDLLAARGFIDHIFHPAAILHYLMGPMERMSYEWDAIAGGSVTSILFASGAVGSLHLAGGSARSSPLEHVEVVGRDSNVVVDNGVRITYYRPGAELEYGRTPSYIVPDEVAPLRWEPEYSLGQLYNKNLFFLGYVPEVLHFCDSVLAGKPPAKGTLTDALHIMNFYEMYQKVPSGVAGLIPPFDADLPVESSVEVTP